MSSCQGPCLPYCTYNTTKIVLILFVILLVLLVISMAAKIYSLSGNQLISAKNAKFFIKKGVINKIIDIRTKIEYNLGHYPNSVHLPVNEINKNSVKKMNKNLGILVYCNTGQRARIAAEKLNKLGFKYVYYIDGTYKSIITDNL